MRINLFLFISFQMTRSTVAAFSLVLVGDGDKGRLSSEGFGARRRREQSGTACAAPPTLRWAQCASVSVHERATMLLALGVTTKVHRCGVLERRGAVCDSAPWFNVEFRSQKQSWQK